MSKGILQFWNSAIIIIKKSGIRVSPHQPLQFILHVDAMNWISIMGTTAVLGGVVSYSNAHKNSVLGLSTGHFIPTVGTAPTHNTTKSHTQHPPLEA